MIRALIVDDSPGSRHTLVQLLNRFCPEVHLVGEASGVSEALDMIAQHDPNLLFLDIEMPHGSGFDLLKQLTDRKIEVIFVTAFDQYAIQAIKYSALDYLLKPVDREELIQAVSKAKERLDNGKMQLGMDILLENLRAQNESHKKLAVPTMDGFEFIPVGEIVRCEGEGAYTRIFLKDGVNKLTTRRMRDLELLLEQQNFFRIHRSHLVNISFIQRFYRGVGGQVELIDGTSLSVARNRRDELLRRLNVT
ncbi:LytTR family DNA-binding domain-containing protein [Pontibacter sp. G13]|uniref:LytR/AlgR family response regulator transcription factor n=1 Tax=Pontibacter sp. G13 TaxID=3074898 RepID=UPI00288931F0|nr:LytTR family DNA-binding domain-containing protein [Pontibacter sp. G13]WNJ21133.1 LytTR family DNA-binding domain-containing protein [Pontibacter sp. G13]